MNSYENCAAGFCTCFWHPLHTKIYLWWDERRDADKFLSKQGWIGDGLVNSGLIYCYNENKIKEPLKIKIRNNQIFECDMKSCAQYKMFRVCPYIIVASKKKGAFQR